MSQLDDEKDGIVKWHAVTHSPFWDETVQALADMRCREANLVCVDYRRPDEERKAAGAKFEAWAEIRGLREQWERAYAEMRAAESSENASEELVGAKLSDQWYEHQDEG